MPIYAYRCERCGHELDALQKQLTAPGFQLKGSGWYQTDFRGGAKPAAAAPAASEAKAEAKSESPAPAAGCGSGCSCH